MQKIAANNISNRRLTHCRPLLAVVLALFMGLPAATGDNIADAVLGKSISGTAELITRTRPVLAGRARWLVDLSGGDLYVVDTFNSRVLDGRSHQLYRRPAG